jgi:hypothetical protein
MVEKVLKSDVFRDDGVFFDRPGVAVLKWDPTSESV